MEFAMIQVPAAPMRRKADHRSEMVSQLLFGESVELLKTKGEFWVKVRSLHDGYEGWLTNSLILEVDERSATAVCSLTSADILGRVTMNGATVNIPIGSTLPFFKEEEGGKINGSGSLGSLPYSYTGQILKRDDLVLSPMLIQTLCFKWLNAPYLWGGRTPLGVDCSGFVQVIFKMLGIDLPRDARQQAQKGKLVEKFTEICPGDLAFFDNKEDITHVGILLGDDQVIHSSGKVRTDIITKKGIVHSGTGKKGPRLKTIRRNWL